MRTLFVGGSRHLLWLDVDPGLHDVQLPWIEQPIVDFYDPGPDTSFRLDFYREQRVVHTAEHPCVRGAGVARIYRVFTWSNLPGDLPMHNVVATIERERGPYVEQHPVGVPHPVDAPDWWIWPGVVLDEWGIPR